MTTESEEKKTAQSILLLLKETYSQHVDEMAVPQVGLFYVIEGEVSSYCQEAREAPMDNLGIRHARFNHEEYWKIVEKVLERASPGPEQDWRYYPRGKVFYDEEKRKFHLVADRCVLEDEAVVQKVMSDFHLPRDR